MSAAARHAVEKQAVVLQRLRRDWEKWRGTRAFPAREDFDPLELRYILGSFSLIDVVYDPLRFRCRLHASSSVERLGADLTGKFIDEAGPATPARATVLDNLTRALACRAPFWICHERMIAKRAYGRAEILVLPFSSDGQTIDVLGLGMYLNHAERRQRTPSIVESNLTSALARCEAPPCSSHPPARDSAPESA